MITQLWACEPEHLQSYCDRILRASDEAEKSAALTLSGQGQAADDIYSVDGDTATIRIEGMLTKNAPSFLARLFGLGGTTYGEILSGLARAGADDSVKTVRLAINSPGGEILGLDDVWQAVREVGKKKSVVAENRGLMASAAYWTASAASRIVATSPAALTGSIGVQMVTYDYSEADKEYGVRRVRITSKNAPKKNPDATTDDGRAVYQEQLDAIERVFISRISEGRGLSEEKIIKNFGQGALMIAEDPNKSMISAISVNMIDRVIGGESDRNSRKIDEKIEDANIRGAIESTDDTPEEGKNMATLAEIMKTDTAIKAEVEALTDAAYARGQSDTKSRNAKATAILASDKYPELIKAMAMQVLTGEKTAEALDGAVAYCDQMAERDKAAAAVKETVTAGPTPAAPPVVASPDGEVRSNDDHMAAVNRVRAAQGQKEIK